MEALVAMDIVAMIHRLTVVKFIVLVIIAVVNHMFDRRLLTWTCMEHMDALMEDLNISLQ